MIEQKFKRYQPLEIVMLFERKYLKGQFVAESAHYFEVLSSALGGRCGHKHRTQSGAKPCLERMQRRLYSRRNGGKRTWTNEEKLKAQLKETHKDYAEDVEALSVRAEAAEREIARLNNKCDLMIRQDREEVWYWADDGEDHPESLACPALIKPDVVRRFVAAEQRLKEAQAEIKLLRHNRNEALKDEDDSF